MKTNESILYVIVVLAFLIFIALLVLNYEASRLPMSPLPQQAKSTLTISATGTAYNSSSQSDLYVTVNGTGLTNAAAVQNVSATLSQFNSTISKYVNGNLSRITTTYFNTYKIYNQTGYEATEGVTVIIPKISNTSAAIGAVSNIPGIYVSSATPSLSSSQISAMRTTALSLALSNATSQAHALIGNGTIDSTNISVNNYYVYPFEYNLATPVAAGGSSSAGAITTTIPPQFYGGLNKVTESITVTFIYDPVQK